MEPQVRFCTSADGTRIAYARLGSGRPLVKLDPWPHSFERDWERPEGRAFCEELAQGRLLVEVDRRGVGGSQREINDFSLEAQVADLTAVIDNLSSDSVDLLGSEDAAAVCVAYVAKHPQRVRRLILMAALCPRPGPSAQR